MSIEIQQHANQLRKTLFETLYNAGGGHFGGTLSIMEILVVLYDKLMKYDARNPDLPERDRLVLAKGHAGPALYVVLADKGYFPSEWLSSLDKNGGYLPKHIDRFKVPGVDFSSGSLGQGLSFAVGMAQAAKMDGLDTTIYVILGDGECNEGQVWEAAMLAYQYELDNIIAIVDRNFCQIDERTEALIKLEPFADKWEAFGWNVSTIDGHNIDEIENALRAAKKAKGKPNVIIANTKKGKGISFMEDEFEWHSGIITEVQYKKGITDLEGCGYFD